MSSELVDKKTVIAMIGLPVKMLLGSEGLGNWKELYFQDVASLPQLERIQDFSFQCRGLSSCCMIVVLIQSREDIRESLLRFSILATRRQWP